MPYPSKNTNGYSSPSKNSSTSSNAEQSGQNLLEIGDSFVLLVDATYKLLLEPLSQDWSYQSKS